MSFQDVFISVTDPTEFNLEPRSSGYPNSPRGLARVLSVGKPSPANLTFGEPFVVIQISVLLALNKDPFPDTDVVWGASALFASISQPPTDT